MTNKILFALVMACGTGAAQTSPAKSESFGAGSDQDTRMLRRDLNSARKQIIAGNLELSGDEAGRFWPVYDQFTQELDQITARKLALIKDYLRSYRTLTDEQADGYVQQKAAVEQSALELRLKYIPLFRKVLTAKSTALFLQIEWRVNLMAEMQLASEVPLVDARDIAAARHVF